MKEPIKPVAINWRRAGWWMFVSCVLGTTAFESIVWGLVCAAVMLWIEVVGQRALANLGEKHSEDNDNDDED